MIYLGGPYTDADKSVRQARYEELTRVAHLFVKAGVPVYSPITHNHPLAELGDLPVGWAFWEQFDRLHLRNCSILIILKLDGWEKSTGVKAEVQIAAEHKMPTYYITADAVEHMIGVYKTYFSQMLGSRTTEKEQAT